MTGSLQIKNGKFYMVINTYENGKRKMKWVATGLSEKGNKRKAEQMLRDTLHQYEKEAISPKQRGSEIRCADYLRYWLKTMERRVDVVTLQAYTLLMNRHIVPYFEENGAMLSDVSRRQIQTFLDEKATNGRLDGKGGLSAKSVRELKNLLHQTFDQAIRDELIEVNPCSLLILPPKETPTAKFYSPKQLNELLAAIHDEPLYPMIRTAIVYGLRRSELLGLKWDSIDFEGDTLTISHTVVKVTTIVEKDKTKSKSSHRSFPLLPEMREMFLALRREQEKCRKEFGRAYVKTDYVFCWPDGHPFSPDYVSRKFSRLLKAHGFEHIRFHELRHSCASLLINQGYSLKDVQEWMGHADIAVTANIYGHLEIQRKLDMAAKMSSCIDQ